MVWPLGPVYLGEGISDLAPLDTDRFLAVHDTKGGQDVGPSDGPLSGYVSILTLPAAGGVAGLDRLPLHSAGGLSLQRTPSDLEALCALPAITGQRTGTPIGELQAAAHFLAFESGDYGPAGIVARVYHMSVRTGSTGPTATVHGFAEFTDAALSDIEGAICLVADDPMSDAVDRDGAAQSVTITTVLAQRGGGADGEPARMRRFRLRLETDGSLALLADLDAGNSREERQALMAPWRQVSETTGTDDPAQMNVDTRHVSAMAGPVHGRVILSGARDGGDTGPFASVLYVVDGACLADERLACHPERGPRLALPNVKIEAVTFTNPSGAAHPDSGPAFRGTLVVATDDEGLGGMAWRLPLTLSAQPF